MSVAPSDIERRSGKYSVLMTTEGTYPFHGGGVSTWCDVLIQGMPEVDFHLIAIMMNPFLRQRYDLPPNVMELVRAPIWGLEEPLEFSREIPFSSIYESKHKTSEEEIQLRFVPIFRAFIREILNDGDPRLMGLLLYGMYQFFQHYDYNVTFRSKQVWETFREELILNNKRRLAALRRSDKAWMLQAKPDDLTAEEKHELQLYEMPTVLEATDSLRWLYRFLVVLSHPVPRTNLAHAAAAAFCSIPCVIAKQAYGIPFLLTEHGIYLREQYLSISRGKYSFHSKRFLIQLIRSISRTAYWYADTVSPVCRWNTRWEKRFGVTEQKLNVIYNGVNPDRFRPIPNVNRDSRLTVVTVALIFPLKDIATLIHAADITRKRYPDVQFKLYGSASDEEYYQSCIRLRDKLDLQDNFHFMGRTSMPENAYNEADVVALSSLSEGFPFSVVEAMMCGKPNVATDVGGVSEALGDTGIVVRARRPDQLAEGIIRLLDDPVMRAQMGEDARNRALRYFTIEECIRQYRQAYQDLIDNPMTASYEYAA
jgi:glycosyltransferase involved in cell wall biosynthesis